MRAGIAEGRSSGAFTAVLIAVAFVLGACGGSGGGPATTPGGTSPTASIVGTRLCHYEGDPDTPVVVYEFKADETFVIHSLAKEVDNTRGTWSLQGTSGELTIGEMKRAFTVEGMNLVLAEHPPAEWFTGSFYDPPPPKVTGFICEPEPPGAG